ncbi:hypothetical protein TVAG_136790 [Trichomonas vaginalis G3]|uniref:Uncharacterized protein n=1 Tax=Trichomonas vaginalis (strain ATCC PRA-98 / G3) TaxID=412133 RepID=A2DJG1_TRIV3|nr:hypothetical protein TVAGG3_0543020 [Trichomonas vaginalis G3]EAY19548.1 hypothetical protein TVAG_136790 [Trichomonas vaginalis G3]KAI5519969.1 hypothetical protein TVAGG3_0543020 [Trichomonas vaginalis G3]|eukprot:XP_001580534.1 hypothetical protein [Trichomonas vaginalis G3]
MTQQEDKRWVKAFQAIKREGGDELYKIYVKHLTAGFKKSEFVVKLKEENERILDQLGKANKEIVNLREKLKKYESGGNPTPSKDTTGGYGRQQSKPSANPNVKAEMDKLSKLNDESSKKVKELQAEVDKYKNALLGKGNESEVLDYYAQVGPGITDKLNQNDGFEKINSTVATIFDGLTQWIQQKAGEVNELQQNVQQSANIDVDAYQSKIDELTNHLTEIQQKLVEYLQNELNNIDVNEASRKKSDFEQLISNDEPILNQVDFILNMFTNDLAVARNKLGSIDQEKRYAHY